MDEFDHQIGNILTNVGIFSEVVYLSKQLGVLSKAIDELQSDTTTLSKAVETWLDIIENPSLKTHQTTLRKRFNQHIEPYHLLTNMTDPKYLGKSLASVQENEAEKWLQENYPQFLTGVLKFKIKDSEIFSPLLFSETVIEQFPAKKWWGLAKTKASKSTSLFIT